MLSALEKMQFKRKIQFQHLCRDHDRVDRRDIFVIPVVPDKKGRHMGTGIIDKVQLRGTVFGNFRTVRIIVFGIFLNGIGVVPGGVGNHRCIWLDPFEGYTQPLGQTGRIPLSS